MVLNNNSVNKVDKVSKRVSMYVIIGLIAFVFVLIGIAIKQTSKT
jgi:hypothetical protein